MTFHFSSIKVPLFLIVFIALLFINVNAQKSSGLLLNVNNISNLYAFNPISLRDNSVIIVGGYFNVGDGGGGTFKWSSKSNADDDSGIVIKPHNISGSGRFTRIQSGEPINVKWFGAIPDGSRIVTTSIQTALNKTGHVVMPYSPQAYIINDHLIVKSNTWLDVNLLDTIYEASGNNVVLLRNEHIDTTGITDHDITVTGGVWDGNWAGNPGTANFSKYLQLRSDKIKPVRGASGNLGFYGVRNLKIKNLIVRNAVTFSIQISRAQNFSVENIHFDRTFETVSDGLHINGPSSNFRILNITGKTGDDFIALNAWDWLVSSPTAGGIGGDINNGILTNVKPDTCKWAIIKGYLGSTAGLYNVTIKNIKGVSNYTGICLISSIDQQNPEHITGLGIVKNFIVNKMAASVVNSYVYDGIHYGPLVSINVNVTNMILKDILLDSTHEPAPDQPFLWQHAGTSINTLSVSFLNQFNSLTSKNNFEFNGTVKQFTLSRRSLRNSGNSLIQKNNYLK